MASTTTRATTVTAYLCASGAAEAIEFYKKAFGAEELFRMEDDNGKIGHAEITIGSSTLYVSDEAPQLGVFSPTTLKGSSTSFVISVTNADAAVKRAVEAGVSVDRPMTDAPYGRNAWVTDPYGHRWCVMQANPGIQPSQDVAASSAG